MTQVMNGPHTVYLSVTDHKVVEILFAWLEYSVRMCD